MSHITESDVLNNARTFNAGRRWKKPGLLKANDSNLVNSQLVQDAITGMMAATGSSREVCEDALMRAHNLGEILTPQELADRLKVPESWVYEKQRSRCKNPIPSKPLGRYIRFDWDEVVKWLENMSNEEPVLSKPRGKK